MQDVSLDPAVSAQYHIRRRLGEGGFGEVFEAWDTKLHRSVALKRLKVSSDAPASDRLLEEARMAASLRHSAFVKVYAIDGGAAAQSIVMELVEGRTLRQLAADRPFSVGAALAIAAQIAEAMQEAHAARLVHGDLKPSNLMMEPSGRVRILDFGLARHIDPLATQASAAAGDAPGTIAYMAPERLAGRAPGAAADIYALGVILYELIAGQRPFPDLAGLALAAAQMQSSSALWAFPPDCDPAVAALVRAMTASDPARRTGSMAAAGAAIAALMERPGPAPARAARRWRWPPMWPPALSRPSRARTVALAGALCALLVAGLAAQIWAPVPWRAAAPAYSEAAALRTGLEALRRSDRDGSLDAAVAAFTGVLERNPGNAAAAAGLSLAYCLVYFGAGRDEVWLRRADASAQQALELDDQLALAHAAHGWVLETQGRQDEALRAAERALRLDPRNLFAWWGKADLLIRMRRFDDARAAVDAAAAIYPAERMFADVLGRLHYQRNDYPAAERAFRASIALDPDSVLAYASLSQVLLRQDRGDEALQVLQDGLQVRRSSRLYSNLGTALFARGDYPGAARAFEQAVSAKKGGPGEYLYWGNLADALRWLPGRGADARHAYGQADALLAALLARSPGNVLYQSRRGLYAAKLGARDTALLWSRRAVLAEPDNADVRFRAGVAYELAGDRAGALAELARARALGYPAHLIDTEPDLLALRRDPRFRSPTPESTP